LTLLQKEKERKSDGQAGGKQKPERKWHKISDSPRCIHAYSTKPGTPLANEAKGEVMVDAIRRLKTDGGVEIELEAGQIEVKCKGYDAMMRVMMLTISGVGTTGCKYNAWLWDSANSTVVTVLVSEIESTRAAAAMNADEALIAADKLKARIQRIQQGSDAVQRTPPPKPKASPSSTSGRRDEYREPSSGKKIPPTPRPTLREVPTQEDRPAKRQKTHHGKENWHPADAALLQVT
jgi:hypothetical protein